MASSNNANNSESESRETPPVSSPHRRYSNPTDKDGANPETEEIDQYEVSLLKSGCAGEHYQLQECYYNNGKRLEEVQRRNETV